MAPTLAAELLAAYTEVRRWLTRRLGNAHDAADIAQSSFEQVYAYATGTAVAAPRALLFRAARGLCVDRGRRRQVEARVLATFGATMPVLAPSPEQIASEREALTRASRASRPSGATPSCWCGCTGTRMPRLRRTRVPR